MPGETVARAIMETLETGAQSNGNVEAANVVDGLFAIARGLDRIADAINEVDKSLNSARVYSALDGFAALNHLPGVLEVGLERLIPPDADTE
jgi:hypothetical protein